MTDQAQASVRSLVDRMLDPEMQEQIAHRAREFVAAMGEAAEVASVKAGEAWRESAPIRHDAAVQANKVGRDALKWGRRTWRDELRPGINRIWKSRMAALAAAGAAVPVAVKVSETPIPAGERRRWGTFFAGLLLGAVAGVVAAMLTAPKAGRQIRDDLALTARDAAVRAREAANRAREAAANAGDWMPLFQRSSYEEPSAAESEPPIEAPAARRATKKVPAEPAISETEPAS